MMYLEKPPNFNPKFEVAGAVLLNEPTNEILFLLRQDHKPQPNTWALPAGKRDADDVSTKETIIREVFEETGISLVDGQLVSSKTWYVVFPDLQFIWTCYRITLDERPNVILRNDEHKEYKWIPLLEIANYNLMEDVEETITTLLTD